MGAPAGLLAECQKLLEASPFEYNQSLAPHVPAVWRGLGTYIARQLQQHRAIFLPAFGKFTFLKGKDDAPAFLFSDKFLKAHPRIVTKRPLPALTVHGADANYSTIAAEASVMKDQAQSIVESLFQLLGDVTESGTRSMRIALGSLGHITVDGRSLHVRFDPGFVLQVGASPAVQPPPIATRTVLETLEHMAGIPKPTPTPVRDVSPMFTIHTATPKLRDEEPTITVSTKTKPKRRMKQPSQLVKCASESLVGFALHPEAPSILPRFLIPDYPRASPVTSAVQQLIVEQAYKRLDEETAASMDRKLALDCDYDARFRNTEYCTLKQRAEKALSQRETSATLMLQTLEKQRATLPLPEPHVPLTVLPTAKVRTKAEEKARKAVLRQQLDDQVAMQARRDEMQTRVQRDEERFFLENVHRQDKRERHEAAVQRQLDKDLLLKEWSRQVQKK
ncbi:hypothetical protein SPRG_15518 [Saprolegnia parasitica CBS 223.65]|uniref:CCDC81 HU domain-containing protein n=1 Tax=Saprolegnia parasitica (strain CBS 223.65) TaxID=695850 RepID=A0A067BLL8_SAPPC|nr:hypothetical protein SPRG_15518 [Saprolegnia parasitica CBS 223.65]KDO17615.1 hypothetical protein SPRG_15518 [Saprolegnia parasitica CBS 223.65]|eukprot:XP_012211674.1 hypothetical protein SPRG_15518 [Saprolegnia parasitica CBS 223.65]